MFYIRKCEILIFTYEWSVGYSDYSTPLGIYHLTEEKVWQDAGQLMDTIFTIPKGDQFLHNGISYSVFVKVRYSTTTYAIFKSNGIYVMTQPPSLTSVRGKIGPRNNNKGSRLYEDWSPIEFNWDGKFLAANVTIEKYRLYLSTFPGGHDIFKVDDVIPGNAIGYNMSRVKLTPGVIHYSNIIAYNYAGAHTTSSSDGFMIDHTSPSAGIVYDGIRREDLEYQNSSNTVAARWHGFIDTESGIQSYHWCVGVTSQYGKSAKTECSVVPWMNVGLHNSISRNLSANLQEGTKIYNKVYATDGVGWTSQIVVSDGVVIDTSSPVPEIFFYFYENLIVNPSFEETFGGVVEWLNLNNTDICSVSTFYHPTSWILQTGSCMTVVSSLTNLAKDGSNFLFVRGYFTQHLDHVKAGLLYRISFFTSHLSIKASSAGNKEGFVQLGKDHMQVFILYTRSYRHDGHGVDETREDISWHDHTFFIRATEDNATLTIGSVDITTGIFIDDLSVQEVNLTTGETHGHVLGHVVYLHDWSFIHGSWNFIDPESPIIDYEWAIGYSEGGTQIQPFRSVGLMNFGDNFNVSLVHKSYIYITALAINAAGLKAMAYSDKILVDLTPPDIMYVNDGRGEDEDAWTFNEVAANWAVEDLESGIKFCRWAIGYSPGTTELLPYIDITASEGYMDFQYSVLEGHIVYTTVSCENEAGLSSTLSSNGVRISNTPPSTLTANVETVPLSQTEYTPSSGYSGRPDEIRLKWSGFTDAIGIETFEVDKGDLHSEKMFFPEQQEVLYTHFTKMSLTDDVHPVTVRAINKLFLKSAITASNVTVCTVPPQKDDTKSLAVSWINNEIMVSWIDIFTSNDPLFYEISAGTKQAGVNIVQWQFTNQTSITFGIPPTITEMAGLNVYITVSAVTVGGFSQVKTGTIKLP